MWYKQSGIYISFVIYISCGKFITVYIYIYVYVYVYVYTHSHEYATTFLCCQSAMAAHSTNSYEINRAYTASLGLVVLL